MTAILPGKSIFSPPSPPKPQPLPPLPDPAAAQFEANQKAAEQAAQARRGIASTVQTSGLGDTTAANTKRATLLGSGT